MSEEIKVGDKVRVSKDAPRIYTPDWVDEMFNLVLKVTKVEDGNAMVVFAERTPYKTVLTAIPTKYLIKVEDEPTAPKIKVGDFVRVLENLHEPICLDVERHLEITNMPPHAVSQKEWKIISVEMRRDCAGRIYTLKHDDSFIYNIPEDCVELVQPKEQTEAEKKPNVGSIKIPVEVDLTDRYWDTYTADLAKEIAVKSMEKSYGCDPERIAEYAVSVAKAVVENLKKK